MSKWWRDLFRALAGPNYIPPPSGRTITATTRDGGTVRMVFDETCTEADYARALRWAEEQR